jgi:hypothetical protein
VGRLAANSRLSTDVRGGLCVVFAGLHYLRTGVHHLLALRHRMQLVRNGSTSHDASSVRDGLLAGLRLSVYCLLRRRLFVVRSRCGQPGSVPGTRLRIVCERFGARRTDRDHSRRQRSIDPYARERRS